MRSTKAAKKTKPVEPIRHDDSAPRPIQAAQIALLVMKKVRCQTWKGVIELAAETDIRQKVILSPEQQALIDEYADLLPFLSTSPLVSVIACPVCGRFGLQDKRAPGAKCIFTFRCEGKLVKASSAPPRRAATPREDTEDVPADVAPAGSSADAAASPEAPTTIGDDGLFG